jgi:hypothetical protein
VRGLGNELVNIGDYLFELLIDLSLSSPTLCFLELPPAHAKFGARPQILANIEATQNIPNELFGALQDI